MTMTVILLVINVSGGVVALPMTNMEACSVAVKQLNHGIVPQAIGYCIRQ